MEHERVDVDENVEQAKVVSVCSVPLSSTLPFLNVNECYISKD